MTDLVGLIVLSTMLGAMFIAINYLAPQGNIWEYISGLAIAVCFGIALWSLILMAFRIL